MKMHKSGERKGCDVYISDTSSLNINYMMLAERRLPLSTQGTEIVEADITSISEKMFVGKIVDWLWDNCFNCWEFIEKARPDEDSKWYSDFIVRFDAESDAKKFQDFYNKRWRF